MSKMAISALLLSTTLIAGGALAQPAASPGMASGKFMTEQGMGEYRASKFVGLNVYGSDNQKIGDISEVLMDGQGHAKAVVIGVGGFLGIGQKNVAVPWSSLTWVNERPAGRTATTTAPGATGSTTAPAVTGAPMTAGTPTATAPTTTGMPMTTTGSATAPTMTTASSTQTRSPAEQAAYNGYPDHATVRLTKQELQDAPVFKYYSDTHSASGVTTAPARQ